MYNHLDLYVGTCVTDVVCRTHQLLRKGWMMSLRSAHASPVGQILQPCSLNIHYFMAYHKILGKFKNINYWARIVYILSRFSEISSDKDAREMVCVFGLERI